MFANDPLIAKKEIIMNMNKMIKSDLRFLEKKNKNDKTNNEKTLKLMAVSKYPFL